MKNNNQISILMKEAIMWWNSLPLQDIYDCKYGKGNLIMKYYPSKTDCQDLSNNEIFNIYLLEN